jgi:hypothetical protein
MVSFLVVTIRHLITYQRLIGVNQLSAVVVNVQ